MNPSQVSSQLRAIAAELEGSNPPATKFAVASLKKIVRRLASGAEEVVVEFDDDGWNEDKLYDDLMDILHDADVDIRVADMGIGHYEYWGSREYDSQIGIEEVDADPVEIQLTFEGLNPVAEVMGELRDRLLQNLPTIPDRRTEGSDHGDSYEAEFTWVPVVQDGKVFYHLKY